MYTVLYRSLTNFHKLEFDMFMFITYIFKVTFVANIHGNIGNTGLH